MSEQIKDLTKQLDALKSEIKADYVSGMKEMHGSSYKVAFSERESWRIHPEDWVNWLKKHYQGKRFNELFVATTKVLVDQVRSTMGNTAVDEVGEKGEPVVTATFKRR